VNVSRHSAIEGTGEMPGKAPLGAAEDSAIECELEQAIAKLNHQTPLWQSFLAAHRLIVDQLAEEMEREHQLPLEWFDVLVHLADLPGMQSRQKDLRDRMQMRLVARVHQHQLLAGITGVLEERLDPLRLIFLEAVGANHRLVG